ncbi:MAG: DUF368 domain-containing protein [Candidatus Andersenbacteria bacterium]
MDKAWKTYFKGIIMGAADVVPGVSGGTMALILGIYEKLLGAIADVRLRHPIKTINWSFFIPLGLGIGTSILLLSRIVHIALEQYSGPTFAFFFGLIAVSGYILFRKLKRKGAGEAIALLIGAICAYLFVGLNPIEGIHTLPVIFFSGMVAIMAMILPGISGSFLLLFLGQYEYVLTAIKNWEFATLIVFSLGCAVGLFSFAHFLKRLLATYESLTLAFLIGVIIGSLRLAVHEITAADTSLVLVVIFAVLGFLAVLGLEQLATDSHVASPAPASPRKNTSA